MIRSLRSAATHCCSAVQALPQYYALQYDGCEVPKRAYGNHGAPRLDNSIEFQIWQGSQEDTVTEWEPQGVYNITVPVRRCWRRCCCRRCCCVC